MRFGKLSYGMELLPYRYRLPGNFRRAKIFKDTKENKGVFYACRLWPRVHYCMGGLAINPKAEVINTDLNVIPGLYAAGEVAGGVHGMVRLGTVSIADCVVFGRVAGRNAAQRKI